MRMWMVDPRIMCRKHLLGEHVELHMFVGSINKGVDLTGYLRDNLMEPRAIVARHWQLVQEMEARGYRHKSHMTAASGRQADWTKFKPTMLDAKPYQEIAVDLEASLAELLRRCPECCARAEALDASQ